MPLFMDVHEKVEGLTAEAVAKAHRRDLEVQDEYGVRYLRYWYDEGSGKVFCLVDAPDAEAASAVTERRTVWSRTPSLRCTRARERPVVGQFGGGRAAWDRSVRRSRC